MSEPIIELAKALKTAIDSALSISVERSYAPKFDAEELEEPTWLMIIAVDETTRPRRTLLDNELAVDVALQQALPDPENRSDEFIDTEWLDSRVELLGTLKALFRPGGSLRNSQPIVGAEFRDYTNTPIYRPDLLIEHGIFTGVVRLTYVYELNEE